MVPRRPVFARRGWGPGARVLATVLLTEAGLRTLERGGRQPYLASARFHLLLIWPYVHYEAEFLSNLDLPPAPAELVGHARPTPRDECFRSQARGTTKDAKSRPKLGGAPTFWRAHFQGGILNAQNRRSWEFAAVWKYDLLRCSGQFHNHVDEW